MTNLIIVLGESGTGKSTSIRNLDPKETCIFNILKKPLPMRGYKNLYNLENKNYMETDNTEKIIEAISRINEKRPEIKNIIIDDFSFITNNFFMNKVQEQNWEKFSDIGENTYKIFKKCLDLREDLYCFIMCHTEQNKTGLIVPAKVGTMVGKYVGIEERVTIVFHSQVINMEYKFLTQNDGFRMAKTPFGMFDDLYIDNDLKMIREVVENYYHSDSTQKNEVA